MKKRRRQEIVYIAVENDECELIMFECDTLKELSIWSGWSISQLRFFIAKNKVDFRNKCRYKKVSY